MLKIRQHIAVLTVMLFMMLPGSHVMADSDVQSLEASQVKQLFDILANAQSETEGRYAADAVWQYWFSLAPDTNIRKNLEAAIKRRESYDYEAAELLLNEIVATAPKYAEGYNQRGFILFLREKYELAEQDLIMALSLQPNHFGALSGMFHVQGKLGKSDSALEHLQQAVTIHPWIQERFGLPKALWPESYRKIHEPGTEI